MHTCAQSKSETEIVTCVLLNISDHLEAVFTASASLVYGFAITSDTNNGFSFYSVPFNYFPLKL